MNVKKTLFVVTILLAGLNVGAQNFTYSWHQALKSEKQTTTLQSVKLNDAGDLFTLGNFVSKQQDTINRKADFFGLTFIGTAVGGTSSNRNLILTKSSVSGKFKWAVSSVMGDVDAAYSVMIPTADGGVFLALKARHTNKDEHNNGILLSLKGADNTEVNVAWEYPGNWIYQGVLAKIDGTGKVEWMKKVAVDHSPMPNASNHYSNYTPDGFYFYDATADAEGNIYIAGNVRKTITFEGNHTIEAHNVDTWDGDSQKSVGNAFIVKLNTQGNYLSHFVSGGSSVYDNFTSIEYQDGNLYAAGLIKGNNATVSFGNKTITPPETNSLHISKITPADWSVLWAQCFPGVNINSGNIIQLKSMTTDKHSCFLTGGLNGGLKISGTDTITSHVADGKKRLNGFAIKCNVSDGVCTKGAVRSSKAIGVASKTILSADSVFIYGYDWSSADYNIYLDAYNRDLTPSTQYKLSKKGGSATTWDALAVKDTIVILSRGSGAIALSGLTEEIQANGFTGIVSSFVFPKRNFYSDGIVTSVESPARTDDAASAYFNPFTCEIVINLNAPQQMHLYDLSGKAVYSRMLDKGENRIHAAMLNKGVYIVRYGEAKTLKIVR